ncbi:YicS family protein [Franconibacter helveticus]|uniref:YicS family protein n=1 Tax=Franconibacter helveticus TaxID=357240 RepID=UPI00066E1C44|nr:YicS family protein [Franconibacter helveticus]
MKLHQVAAFTFGLSVSALAIADSPMASLEFYSYKSTIIKDLKKHCDINHTADDDKWLDQVLAHGNNRLLLNNALAELKKNDRQKYDATINEIQCPSAGA